MLLPWASSVFNTSFWRRAVVAAIGVVAFYKYAPAPGDENRIAKYISSTMTPAEVWRDVAFKHLTLAAKGSEETKLMVDAKPPTVHRYRYPQCVLCSTTNKTDVTHCHHPSPS